MNKLALIGIGAIVFISRTVGQWSQVFVDGSVIFRGQDSWYHMRLAQVLIYNYPNYLHNDFFVNPIGQPPVGYPPFLTFLIATPGLILSEHATEVYAALLPPVFAVLTVVVVYFLAKAVLQSKTHALIAALLMGVLPTQFFHRTLLGFTDHHFLEVFLVSLSLLLLLKRRYILLGLSLGTLFLTWTGTGYIILVLTGAVLVRTFQLRWRNEDTTSLSLGFAAAVIIAGLVFLPIYKYSTASTENVACLIIGAMTPVGLAMLARRAKSKTTFVAAVVVSSAVLLIGLFWAVPVTSYWGAVFGRGSGSVLSGMSPSTITSALASFGLPLLLFIPGLVLYARKGGNLILPVFTIPILISTISQVRFGYYLIIPVAILATYFLMWAAKLVRPHLRTAVTAVMVVFILTTSLVNIIRMTTFENTMSPSMYEALVWMRENTPEPNVDFYDANLDRNASYQVLAWWDYGSWIAYVARRAPLTSPRGWYLPEMTLFFTDGDETHLLPAEKLYGAENFNVQYVLLDKPAYKLIDWVRHVTGEAEAEVTSLQVFHTPDWKQTYENNEVIILERQ